MSSFVVRGAPEVHAMLRSGRVGAGGWSGLGEWGGRRSGRCGGPGRSSGSGLPVLAWFAEGEFCIGVRTFLSFST